MPIELAAVVVRCPDARRMREGWRSYRKGWEARLVVRWYCELDPLRAWLSEHGLRPGAPYQRALRYVQPVYGERQVRKLGYLLPAVARLLPHDVVAEQLLDQAAHAPDARERDRAIVTLVARGLRQADVARRLGVTRQLVHRRLARLRMRGRRPGP